MNIAVFGANGHVGKAASLSLAKNHRVLAFGRTVRHYQELKSKLPQSAECGYADVRHGDKLKQVFDSKKIGTLEAVIYCVGHCPPSGFKDAIKRPLSEIKPEELDQEIIRHAKGPVNIFQRLLPNLQTGGHFVFMSSAATRILRLPAHERPPLQIYHHLAVIAAMDALIEGMRMDPEVIKRNIRIHRILPPAIGDSPFHRDSHQLSVSVSTNEVVAAIASCLETKEHQDKILVPTPRTNNFVSPISLRVK